MHQFKEALQHIRATGVPKADRTGTGTLSTFGYMQRFALDQGQPHETLKYTPFKEQVVELLWIISGSTRLRFLKENKVRVWDEWVKPGTEVWGERYTYEQRGVVFQAMLDRKVIKQQAVDDYIDSFKVSANIQFFDDKGDWCTLFDFFKVPTHPLVDGELGPVYGKQWRFIEDTRTVPVHDNYNLTLLVARGFNTIGTMTPESDNKPQEYVLRRYIDQLQNVLTALREKPDDRGIIINAWHVPDLDDMALRPCHTLVQFETRLRDVQDVLTDIQFHEDPRLWDEFHAELGEENSKQEIQRHAYLFADKHKIQTRILNCLLYMRSNDAFLGRPFNVSQYALLTSLIAHCENFVPGEFILMNGDLHIYANHEEQVREALSREPLRFPHLWINPAKRDLFAFGLDDIRLENYEHHAAIKAPVAK